MKISSCVLGISLILSFSISVFAMDQVACTMEAKMCPDGSFVGRTGPACEFAACPSATGSVTPPIVGGGIDQYGCKPSTGYTWDSTKRLCCRSWEANECIVPQSLPRVLTPYQQTVIERRARVYVGIVKRQWDLGLDAPFIRGMVARLDARSTEKNQYLKELLTELLTR